MAWLRFDDNYPQHPKVIGLTANAFTLNTCAICYAGRHHTDGFLPAAIVPRLWHFPRGTSVPRLVRELLAARLWEETEGGHLVHDFLEYNPSSTQQVIKAQTAREQRTQAGRARAAHAVRAISGRFSTEASSGSASDAPASDQRAAGKSLVPADQRATSEPPAGGEGVFSGVLSNKVETAQERKGGSDSGLSLLPPLVRTEPGADFERFWSIYPKRRSKADAFKAWLQLKPDQELVTTILAAVERWSRSTEWRKDGGQFIPYPASWLRAHGWQDESTVDPSAPDLSAYNAMIVPRKDRR